MCAQRFVLVPIASALVCVLGCQPTFWRLYGGSGAEEGRAVVELSDGFATAGSSTSNSPFAAMQVLRTDRFGNLVWSRDYGSDAVAVGLAKVDGDDLVVAGTSGSVTQQDSVATVLRIDPQGGIVWERDLPDDPGYSRSISSLRATTDGGFVLAGNRRQGLNPDAQGLLVKIDAFGYEEWSQTFGGPSYDTAFDVELATDGGYVVAGSTDSAATVGDAWLAKLDSNGLVEWQRAFGGADFDSAHAVVPLENGDYLASGAFVELDGNPDRHPDVYLLRVDAQGDLLWQKHYGDVDVEDVALAMKPIADGVILAGGRGYIPDAINYDVLLLAADLDGNELWRRTLASPANDEAFAIEPTLDGGFVITGASNFTAIDSQTLLIKTDADGNTVPAPITSN